MKPRLKNREEVELPPRFHNVFHLKLHLRAVTVFHLKLHLLAVTYTYSFGGLGFSTDLFFLLDSFPVLKITLTISLSEVTLIVW